jgi:hypothetical protein
MEPKFQTSFIPKKPLTGGSGGQKPPHSISIILTIGIIVFLVSIVGAGFTLVYEKILDSQQSQYQVDLTKEQDQFNTTLISTLNRANTKIGIAESLIQNHLAVSEIFSIISQLTVASVEWKSFTFNAPDPGLVAAAVASGGTPPGATISMQGETDSYYSVAYQSDVFGKSTNFGLGKAIRNPVLSNLSVAPDGKVGFTFTASIDPSELSYAAEVGSSTANQ